MTKKQRKYTPRPTTREANVYEGPVIKETPLGDKYLIRNDGAYGRANDGSLFTGFTRVPATGWGGTKTTVRAYVHNGEIERGGFNINAIKHTWPVLSKVPGNILTSLSEGMELVGQIEQERALQYRDLGEAVSKEVGKLPSLTDRLTPSDVEGKSLYQKKQEEREHLNLQDRYKIPPSVQASDAIRLDNLEK